MEFEIENPFGWPNYKIRGADKFLANEAANEFRKALEYINRLPYNMTYTTEQVELRKKDIEDKYQIEIFFE